MSAPTSNSIPPLDSQVAPSSPKMTSEQQDRAAMPPPSFIPRPREPSYTVQQLLAFTVRAAGPPSSSSCSFVKNQGCSPEHRPCRGNEEYEPILVKSLYAINPIIIAEFQARIFSIFAPSIPFLLNDSPAVPWAGGKIVSEDLVTTYVDSQVLCKAWRAVLKMVPVTRDYNLEIVKKTPVDRGIPDQMFILLTKKGPQILAIIEFTAPGAVTGMLSIIRGLSAGVREDLTNDWKAITRQLRKYADCTGVRDILVMDERTGIYFEYPDAAYKSLEHTTYLVASADQPAGGGISGLSMQELVVFVFLRSLDRKSIELCDARTSVSARPQSENLPKCLNTLSGDPGPSDKHKKRPGPSPDTSHQMKRTRIATNPVRTSLSTIEQFNGWAPGLSVQLEFIPHIAPIHSTISNPRCTNFLSFRHNDGPTNQPRKIQPVPAILSLAGFQLATLIVHKILSPNVAILSTENKSTYFIGKHFGLDTNSPKWFSKELAAYTTCVPLQGVEIPYLLGVCHVVQASPFSNIVMLTEYIDPGTTIGELIFNAFCNYDTNDDAEIARLIRLKESGKQALKALHDRFVVHCDITGKNLVVATNEKDAQEERVVIVDFDCSAVLRDDSVKYKTRVGEDQAMLRASFVKRGRGPFY